MPDNDYTRLDDTVSSHEGKAYATIDGSNRPLFELSKLTAQIELTVQSKRMLGHRMTQHKVVGGEGTGNISMYFMNSQMLNRTIQYLNSGKYNGITIQCYNEDASSTIGRQEVVLTNVITKTIPAAIIDDDSDDPITWDSDITFDDIQSLSSFAIPLNYKGKF
jgi:hypothetical protein